jgi:hypothetical protein
VETRSGDDVNAGEDVPGETRKRGPKKDEKFQERKDGAEKSADVRQDPARTPETTQREEAVNWFRKRPERAPARESTRWPSETTNHEVGQLERPTTNTWTGGGG